jgi:trimethylamine monooxygenase
VWEDYPNLFYLGMQDQYYTFNMFDAQAWFVRDVILGKIALPEQKIMRADSFGWRQREQELKTAADGIYFQGDYVKDLLTYTDYPKFDVDAVNETFIAWKHHKHDDIMGYRDHTYRSIITGNMQPQHHTRWVEALDDSLENYLQTHKIVEKNKVA